MTAKVKYNIATVLWSAIILLLFILISSGPLASRRLPFHNFTLDLYMSKAADERPESRRIVIIGIDRESLEKYSEREDRSNLSRRQLAEIVEKIRLAGARVIGLDILFPDQGDPEGDSALRAALREWNGRAVLSVRFVEVEKKMLLEKTVFGDVATAGVCNVSLDSDGFNRRILHVPGKLKGQYSFALHAALLFLEQPVSSAVTGKRAITIFRGSAFERAIPVNEDGETLTNFMSRPSFSDFVPAWKILTGKYDPEKFRDRLVLVGGYADAFADRHHTVLSPRGQMPGVEILATNIDNILTGTFTRELDRWTASLLFILCGLLATVFFIFLSPLAGFLVLIISWPVFISGFYSLFLYGGLYVDSISLLLAVTIAFIAVSARKFFFVRWERQVIEEIFEQYVSPEIVKEILKDPEKVKLGGEKRNITVLFSDIRGFMSLCEKVEPSLLVSFLNDYFSAMVNIIFRNHGTLDKFIGDGIMVMFGAPLSLPDDAVRAVRTALEMKEETGRISDRWKERGIPAIEVGFGINTGEVVVGNVGAVSHMEYTGMGSTVNLASRLESAARGNQILISESTREAIGDRFEVQLLPPMKVKGKEEAITVFEVRGEKKRDCVFAGKD